MVRSQFIVVSDDQALVQKAQQFGQMHGVTVQVMTPEQWSTSQSQQHGEVPSLVAGQNSFQGEGAKVLPFPGTQLSQMGAVSSERRGVATINQLEASAIENAIGAFKGNLTEAAKALGIGRATLYRKVKQYNIDPSAARNKKKAA
jgi:transcriptional regulator of acetoin/glycerol metabolism